MKYAAYIVLGLIALLIVWKVADAIGGGNSSSGGEVVKHTTDTLYAKPDTVVKTDTLYYTKLKAVLDTVYIDSTEIQVASADTLIEKDSSRLRLKYFFPPLNYFDVEILDIKERLITQTVTILDSVTVEVEKPFFKSYWFYSTVILGLIMILLGK